MPLFDKLEIIKTPDKEEYEVRPLATEDVKLLLDFIEAEKGLNKLKVKSKKAREKSKEAKESTEVDEVTRFSLETLIPIADKVINKSIFKVGSEKDVLPMKYRNLKNRITLAYKIVGVTTGDILGDEGKQEGNTPEKKSSE